MRAVRAEDSRSLSLAEPIHREIGPGEISTPMTGAVDEDPRSIERQKLPLGRPGHAREIAAWVAFLASERSSYATGASFVVDGGLTLMAAELSS
jgi:NAD(P)-dependent dehydrogenase (short-subunit alcohol dehydrogenase family)